MTSTGQTIMDRARALLDRTPGLSPIEAQRRVLYDDPSLAEAHHRGQPGTAEAPPPPQAQPEMVDPGHLLQLHAAQAGYSFAEAARDHPRLADAWHRAELVQAPQVPPASPPRPTVEIARFKAPSIPAEAIGTASIKGLRIFRAGKWNSRTYSIRDLDAMVEAFPVIGYQPPVTLGHDDRPDAPAHGRVTGLRRDGEFLVADVEGIPAETMAMIKEGRLLSLSAEIYFDLDRGGRKYSRALRSVALLGGHPPGVSGLPSLQEAIAS